MCRPVFQGHQGPTSRDRILTAPYSPILPHTSPRFPHLAHKMDLSVGQVSSIIAAAIFLFQFAIPIALPMTMLGLLRLRSANITATAVSWSAIGRFIQSSLWPQLLQTNSAGTFSVAPSVSSISFLRTFSAALLGVAATVTPLGLHESIVPSHDRGPQTFHYIKDPSPIGFGTPPQTNTTWSRICGYLYPVVCPNSANNLTTTKNATGIYIKGDGYDSHIAPNVVDIFQSGASILGPSVSSIFDIKYRSLSKVRQRERDNRITVDNGSYYDVGSYRPLASLLLSNSFQAVEGLVVNMKNGGIGFRNHSAPVWQPYGSAWTEDLLFIEPETACVDTNLTLDFSIYADSFIDVIVGLVLTDRGGFVNINHTYPRWDRDSGQTNPDLWLRAYKAAWMNNAWTMAFMNVTNLRNETTNTSAFAYLNSHIGKEFSLHWKDGTTAASLFSPEAGTLQTVNNFGNYLNGLDEPRLNYTSSNFSSMDNSSYPQAEPALYSNPFKVDATFGLPDIDVICRGSGGADLANITSMTALCGTLYGAPRRRDGSASLLFDPGSSWTLPMYSCISTVKASIKTVSFRFNGSDDLSGLTVTSIAPKTYPNDASKPLWGVEHSNVPLRDAQPLWGLVTPESASRLKLDTLRRESLYLPGYTDGSGTIGYQNLPGTDFPLLALADTFSVGLSSSKVDYSGASNLAMYRLWQELSRNASDAGKILNLIWTDIATNLVLGTKGLQPGNVNLTKRDSQSGTSSNMPIVTTYTRRVKYHYPYGIPAFVTLVLAAAILFATACFMLLGSARPSYMRLLLEETSVGRLLTSYTPLQDGVPSHFRGGDGGTKDWARGPGQQQFTLSPEGWSKDVSLAMEGEGGLFQLTDSCSIHDFRSASTAQDVSQTQRE
ncbi:hypothetical protein HD806DRAFT_511740 [Xylariaceae sp. AK1471]|nr:hypothetical protein HD806DRAFT_511740 [Xylariaceae sp. AK1471]